MSLLNVVLLSAVALAAAYWLYGRLLARLFKLDPGRPTPAVEMRDDVDYVPIAPRFLLSQHFSAFADITASSFVGVLTLESGQRLAGGAIATSSMLYLALPVLMGLLLRYAKLPLGWATV